MTYHDSYPAFAPLNVRVHFLLTGSPVLLDGEDWLSIPEYDNDGSGLAIKLIEAMLECEYCSVRVEGSHYHGYSCVVRAAHESQRRPRDIVKRDARSSDDSVQSFSGAVCSAFVAACSPFLGS